MGSEIFAFSPAGKGTTVKLSVSATTSRVALSSFGDGRNVRFFNRGTKLCYLKFGDSTVESTASAMPLPSGAIEIFEIGPEITHVAAICDSTETATLYATSGKGV